MNLVATRCMYKRTCRDFLLAVLRDFAQVMAVVQTSGSGKVMTFLDAPDGTAAVTM